MINVNVNVNVRLVVEGVVSMEEGGAVVELWHQDWVWTGDHVGGDAGQEEEVHSKDEEEAGPSKFHPFVSDQRQAERMPVQHCMKKAA